MSVQRPHDLYTDEHRRAAALDHEEQAFNRRAPLGACLGPLHAVRDCSFNF